jgi:cytochrome c oxidase subunit I
MWTVGMAFMSGAMHLVGLFGAPRRTAYTTYSDHPQALDWVPYQAAMAIGGTILFIAILLLMYIVGYLAFKAPKGEMDFPVGEVEEEAAATPVILENWKLWVGICAALILIAYTIPFWHMIEHGPPGSPGYKFW